MFEEAISLLSIWASMNSWLTPTVLFLLLNLMIGTIAVTSGFTSHKPTSHHHHHEHHLHHLHHHQPQIQTQLTRAPSVLQRLKSLNFYSYIHTPQQPLLQIHQQPPTSIPSAPAAEPIPQPEIHPPEEEEEVVDDADDDGPTLEEVYSRIIQKQSNPQYGRQNSDTKPVGGEIPVRLPAKIKKSASDKSAFNHFEAVEQETETTTEMATVVEEQAHANHNGSGGGGGGGGHEVDARADDFINRFRQQLQMQRLDSIVRYKEMINRGSRK